VEHRPQTAVRGPTSVRFKRRESLDESGVGDLAASFALPQFRVTLTWQWLRVRAANRQRNAGACRANLHPV
jgi:hypothetical protein